jgi:hypothetical protein
MNILMDKPPEQVEVDGKLYKINSDFRTSIQFEILMQKKELTEKQKEFANELCLLDKEMDRETAELLAKYKDGLELYYPEIPNDINGAINAMLWFYECGKENIDKKKSKKSGSRKKIYDYNYDADYIYAAFFEQYHIDLAEQELHWWKFSALFSALSEDCMISKIITYRVIDTKGMEKEQKVFYNRMKRLYQLPEDISEKERERQDKITQALLGDGDLTGIL